MHTTIFINKQHEKILVKRRRLNNQLCSEKTANGPIVMNFTGLEIPSRLLDQLKNGLKTVRQFPSKGILTPPPLQNGTKLRMYSCIAIHCCTHCIVAHASPWKDKVFNEV